MEHFHLWCCCCHHHHHDCHCLNQHGHCCSRRGHLSWLLDSCVAWEALDVLSQTLQPSEASGPCNPCRVSRETGEEGGQVLSLTPPWAPLPPSHPTFQNQAGLCNPLCVPGYLTSSLKRSPAGPRHRAGLESASWALAFAAWSSQGGAMKPFFSLTSLQAHQDEDSHQYLHL